MTHRLSVWIGLVVFATGLFLVATPPALAQQQDVPEEVRQELQRRGMSVEEARQRARELGIDLSNPQRALRQAERLGLPTERARALLEAARQDTTDRGPRMATDTTSAPPYPTLTKRPTIEPDSIDRGRLPTEIDVAVPLQSGSFIRQVRPFFYTAAGDSVAVQNVERRRGSVLRGTWGGQITIPRDTMSGTWTLFVQAATQDTVVTMPTGRTLTIFPEGELPRRDTTKAEKDTLEYFGYDTFNTVPQAFIPSATGPVNDSYIVGPSDELRLTVWGAAEFTYDLQVDREGRVTVPNVGQFTAAGKSMNTLREEMRQWLSQSYAGLTSDPPTVFMDLMVTRVKPIQVYVLGEVGQPGGYTVSSFATVFNALYSVGGPLRRGSLRNIQVIRNGEVVETVDLYGYLMDGTSPDPVQLQNNDYIFIPPRGETVAITGQVRRPAFYEVKEDETAEDLVDYAGGLKAEAYGKRFQVERIVPIGEREDPSVAREVLDYNLAEAVNGEIDVDLADGDRVRILSIREATDAVITPKVRSVKVSGAVFQPGRYALNDSTRTVKGLIETADGLTGDAFMQNAQLVRTKDDLDPSSRSLNLTDVMNDDPRENVVLRAGDSLHVASVQEMRTERFVSIQGKVRDPGEYSYREGMTLEDLLYRAGGLGDDEYLKDVFLERADLFRVADDGDSERVIPFHLGDALQGDGMANRELKPEDEVRIYAASVERVEERFVQVSGAVKEPGEFRYRDNMSLKDVILQSGGFTEGANLREVEVTRMVERRGQEGLRATTIRVPLNRGARNVDSVSFSVRDTVRALRAADEFTLEHRDRVFVRTDPAFQPQQTVTIRGEVRFPGEYTILRDNERLSDVLRRAGGVLPTGYLKGGRLLRDTGDTGASFRREGEQVIVEMQQAVEGDRDDDVILRPGDEIVIPPQPNTVAIRGNVANEGLVKHEPGERVEYYLDRAGGVREDTERILLTQASGATFRVNTGWFRRTPEVDDGAIIRVVAEEPQPEGEGVDVGQIATETVSILSSALTVIVLATRAFE